MITYILVRLRKKIGDFSLLRTGVAQSLCNHISLQIKIMQSNDYAPYFAMSVGIVENNV
ncbi:hypothetical protein ACLEE6_03895 [Lonsdalea quercina]|uniref:hypothetical protein n=1 Tax=Lonsdalea quercina TaxID=71657 RepID=UPI001362CEFD|nr:hypothetical protein [Lonsdalea quercina]